MLHVTSLCDVSAAVGSVTRLLRRLTSKQELCAGIGGRTANLTETEELTEIGPDHIVATAGMTETGIGTGTGAEIQGMTEGTTEDTGSQSLGRQKRSW